MSISLTAFLAQIGRAGQEASLSAGEMLKEYVSNLCTEDADGVLHPKMMPLEIEGRKVEIPLLALASLSQLEMDRLEVMFETDIRLSDPPEETEGEEAESEETEEEEGTVPPSTIHIGLKDGLSEHDTHIKVTASFKLQEPAESLETLRDRLNHHLKENYHV